MSDLLLSECDREPIQIPGAVQPHGALMVADPDTWTVTHASNNLTDFIGMAAAAALGRPLADVLGEEVATLLRHDVVARRGSPAGTTLETGLWGEPLRVVAHLSRSGGVCIELLRETPSASAEQALAQAQRLVQSLRLSRSCEGLCAIVVNEIRRLTGFDRVMVYRFDEDGSGEVIAEDRGAGVDSFLGLRYPASDIPQQARRLYLMQRLRIIPDVDAPAAALLAAPDLSAADVDLSHSSIRAVSPIHLRYLRNMGVVATAVVSLIVGGRLWGMLVCHHSSPRQVGAELRAVLDLIGQVMSVMLGSLSERALAEDRLRRQRALGAIVSRLGQHGLVLAEALAAAGGELLKLVPADGAVVILDDRCITIGRAPAAGTFRAISSAVGALGADDVAATQTLAAAMDQRPESLEGFAGALLLPIPCCGGGSVVWLRNELSRTVHWAGNPAKPIADDASGRLQPRESFAAWKEEVHGQSAAWTETDIDAARDLRRAIEEALARRSEANLLMHLRDTDPLTGLGNRSAVEEHLSALAAMPDRPRTVLVFLNIDRFRKINESLGYAAGDALLVQVANRLRLAAAPGELLVRLGADEFVILTSDGSTASDLATRVFGVFAQPFETARRKLQLYASIGVADSLALHHDPTGLLSAAEAAMRRAKQQGGNRVSDLAQSVQAESERQLMLEQEMDAALRMSREQFHIALQPIVSVADGKLRCWEALARWNHPTLGNVPPDIFIPIAEHCGLIYTVGDLVMDAALRHAVDAPPAASPEEQDVYLSVNVSPLQLARKGFADDLAAKLEAAGLAPERLCVEVTESVLADREALDAIAAARALGVLVAVDDFGVGYSSLSTLRRLPADVVKLDRSFLPPPDASPSAEDLAFLEAVTTLARTAGLQLVLEGVESQPQLHAAVRAGVDAVQGFLIARPMTGEAAVASSCRAPSERSWHPLLEAARRLEAGARLAGG